MSIISALLLAAVSPQVNGSNDPRVLYGHNPGRCLNDRAKDYLGADAKDASKRLAAECLSYAAPLPTCPTAASGMTAAWVRRCEAENAEMKEEIRALTERDALTALELAREGTSDDR